MKKQVELLFTLLVIFSLVGGWLPASVSAQSAAYVESGLLTAETAAVSVIVTGSDAAAAAQAVEQAGGVVTSDLWLIDAVAATVNADRVAALAADARVTSIVDNKGVRSAYEPIDYYDYVATKLTNGMMTDQAWPVAMDVGADQVHADGITGDDVTVAVVDSGVFFAYDLIYDESQQIVWLYRARRISSVRACVMVRHPFSQRSSLTGIVFIRFSPARMLMAMGRTSRASSGTTIGIPPVVFIWVRLPMLTCSVCVCWTKTARALTRT